MSYLEQVRQSPQRQNLALDLREQLAKDLELNLTDIPEEALSDWLSNWLASQIESLALDQLLYRIDLPEKTYSQLDELAQAILEREAQKVIFRAQYSGRL